MSKFATKAAANMFCQARYEAAKSNERLSSREGAAEEIGIDRTRLARIELGSTIPYQAELLSTGGTRQFDTNAIINRYDTKIAQTVLADFIMLGHEKTGSFALSSDKTELFSVALGAFLDIICETFNNQGI